MTHHQNLFQRSSPHDTHLNMISALCGTFCTWGTSAPPPPLPPNLSRRRPVGGPCHGSPHGGFWKRGSNAPPPPPLEAPVRRIILQMRTPARASQCWSQQTSAWTRSVHLNAPGQRHGQQPVSETADPGVVKQDKSSRGSIDTTKTRPDPQRVGICSGERSTGKQTKTTASCQAPPRAHLFSSTHFPLFSPSCPPFPPFFSPVLGIPEKAGVM